MKELSEIYGARFFARRNSLAWRVPIVTEGIIKAFGLKRGDILVDCGCATGDFIKGFRARGIVAEGIEGSIAAEPYLVCPKEMVFFMDLGAPIETYIKRSLAMSLEVAEHLHEFQANIYVENLTKMSDTVLITAAPPGQKGLHHVNCQPPEYWIDKFAEFDFGYHEGLVSELKKQWQAYKKKKGINAYFSNCLVFTRSK